MAQRSPDALIVSLTLDRVVAWKVLSLPRTSKAPFVPVGYGSKATMFLGRAKPGATLWVVSTVKAGAVRMQTLVARLRVCKRVTRADPACSCSPAIDELLDQWGDVAIADPGDSEFFGLNDAGPALRRLGIESMRFMHRRSEAEAMRAFRGSTKQSRERAVFISYRHGERGEGKAFALALARSLVELGASPWLDTLSIPRYRLDYDRRKELRLMKLLRLGVYQSRMAIVIATPDYGESPWTQRERRWIHERRRSDPSFRCVQVERGASKLREPDASFSGDDPAALARAIMRRWRRR